LIINYQVGKEESMVALIRRSPNGEFALEPFFRPFSLLEEVEEMARAFDTLTPKLDMYEDEKELVIKAELPGIRKKDINIRLEGDRLTIKTEKREELCPRTPLRAVPPPHDAADPR
jgi:HSP20 family molecular chaperone IbpA